ncbi:MAG: sigma-54-dependent Fis family transcriptional regulator [Ignavibacteria bacterium]|nr:sigma-54-dependent Fis family transcriptional regulator [Ignavibacteria bacterium]
MEETLFPPLPVLMVDDEVNLLNSYEITLNEAGINNIITCSDSRKAHGVISSKKVEVLMLDLSMPYITGDEILKDVVKEFPDIPIIIITGNNEIETAVECMKLGAFDYLLKPIESSRLTSSVKRAIELRELRNENSLLKQRFFSNKLEKPEVFSNIITGNDQMRGIFQYMEAISGTSEPILITGETGVGKDLIARAIHILAGRKGKFVSTNVAGLDDQMFSDTLFGHKKGSFTNAITDRPGLIERAAGGTIFLDEIGDLSIPSQVKLLRLLQEHEYYQIGSDDPKYSDAMVIVATNHDLNQLQESREFRKDLYYRLNTHHIHLPPLRERADDIPLLVDYFMMEAAKTLGKKKPTAPPELITLLSCYHFPGNIRELRSMIYDAISVHKSRTLSLETFKKTIKTDTLPHLKNNISDESVPADSLVRFFTKLPTLKQVQQALIDEALKRTNNNQSIAAQYLGVTRQALSRRLKNERDEDFE